MKKLGMVLSFLVMITFYVQTNVHASEVNAPSLEINGAKYVLIEHGTNWTDLGATAYDYIDGQVVDISNQVSSSFDPNMLTSVGDYIIKYQVTLQSGEILKADRTLKVVNDYTQNEELIDVNIIGGSMEDAFHDTHPTLDGGYIAVGYSESMDHDLNGLSIDQNTAIIVKYNDKNEIEWKQTVDVQYETPVDLLLGFNFDDYVHYKVTQLNNGHYIVSGGYSGSSSLIQSMIVELDSTGTIVNQITTDAGYGITNVVKSNDGGFYAVGTTWTDCTTGLCTDGNYGGQEGIIIKYNQSFVKEWDKSIGGSSNDLIYDLVEYSDGSLFVTGYTYSTDYDFVGMSSTTYYDGFVLKLNADMTIGWLKPYAASGSTDYINNIKLTSDNHLLVSGKLGNYGLFAKLTLDGQEVFMDDDQAIYTDTSNYNNQFILDTVELPNGNYLMAGYVSYPVYIALIFEYNSDGELVNRYFIDETYDNLYFNVTKLTNNDIVFSGTSTANTWIFDNDLGSANFNALTYKIKNNPYKIDVNNEAQIQEDVNLEGNLTVLENGQEMTNYDLVITNSLGEVVTSPIQESTIKTDTYQFDTTVSSFQFVLSESINFNDYVYPVINLNGPKNILIEKGNTYVIPEPTATDTLSGVVTDLTSSITQTVNGDPLGTVDFNTVGDYFITYSVTDEHGNMTTVERKIRVIENNDSIYNSLDDNYSLFSGSGYEMFNKVIQTSDGGYIVVGGVDSTDLNMDITKKGGTDALIVKYNHLGEVEWQRTFGGEYSESFNSIIEVEDGFVAVGYGDSYVFPSGDIKKDMGNSFTDGLIVKFDKQGNVVWYNLYGGGATDIFYDVIKTSQGTFMVVGEVSDFTNTPEELNDTYNGGIDGIIVEFDSNGQALWDEIYGGSNEDIFYYIEETTDGYYVIGETESLDGEIVGKTDNENDILVLKMNDDRTISWSKIIEENDYLQFDYAKETKDGGLLISTTKHPYSILIKLDSAGNEVWRQAYNDYDQDRDIKFKYAFENSDGSFVLIGEAPNGYIIFNIDSNGNEVSREVSQFYPEFQVNSVIKLSDNHYILVGGKFIDYGNIDIALLEINKNTTRIEGVSDKQTEYKQAFDEFTDVIAYNQNGDLITPVLIGEVNTNQFGMYELVYHVSDGDNLIIISRQIDVIDTINPTINLNGPKYITIEQGSTYTIPSPTASDLLGGTIQDLTLNIETLINGNINSTIDFNVLGEYVITYTVSDEYGNITTEERIIHVVEKYNDTMRSSFDDILKTFGDTSDDTFQNVLNTSDGGYIIIGSSRFYNDEIFGSSNGFNDAVLIKYNSLGEMEWYDLFGGYSSELFNTVIETSDGYVAVGYGSSYNDISGTINNPNELGSGSYDGLIVKYDKQGQLLWYNLFGSGSNDFFYDVLETSNGHFLAVGKSYKSTTTGELTDMHNGFDDGLIVAFDANGNAIWNEVYGGDYFDHIKSIEETDTGYIAFGMTNSDVGEIFSDSYYDQLFMVHIGFDYSVSFSQIINLNYNDVDVESTLKVSDVILIYGYESLYAGDRGFIIKTDLLGNEIWRQYIEHDKDDVYPKSVILNADGTFTVFSQVTDGYIKTVLNSDGSKAYEYINKLYTSFELTNATIINDEQMLVGSISVEGNGKDMALIQSSTNTFVQGIEHTQAEYGEIFDPYLGVIAYDSNGNLFSSNLQTRNSIDSSVIGTQHLVYELLDGEQLIIFSRDIDVVDTVAPTIELNGPKYITVNKGTIYKLPIVTAYDTFGGNTIDLTQDIIMTVSGASNTLDFNTIGQYVISYTVTDYNGNTTTVTKTIQVVDDSNTINNTIRLEGLSNQQIQYGSIFDYLEGVNAYSDLGESINFSTTGTIDSYQFGSYSIIYTVEKGEYLIKYTRIIEVVDFYAPTLTIDAPKNYVVNVGGTFILPHANASDTLDGEVFDLTNNILMKLNGEIISSFEPNQVGQYCITYSVVDSYGNETTEDIYVVVVNIENGVLYNPDTMTSIHGIFDEVLNYKDTFDKHTGVEAIDSLGNTLNVVVTGDVDTLNLGSYEVIYEVTDGSYLIQVTRTISVSDQDAPVINGLTNKIYDVFTPLPDFLEGVSATDNYDTNVIVTVDTQTINMNEVGTYTIIYKASDSSGNITEESITITIEDNKAPVINGTRNLTYDVFTPLPDFLEGVSATDNYDSNLDVTVDTQTLNMNEVGTYTIIYQAIDSSGNISKESITITIEDNEAPVITGHSNKTFNIFDTLPDLLEGVTATDNYDSNVTLTVDTSLVNMNQKGSYFVTYHAIDSNGNITEESITITVEDNLSPTITGHSSKTLNVFDPLPDLLEGVTASDNQDATVTLTVDSSLVNMNVVGTYIVTYRAIDSDGNVTEESIKITVVDNKAPVITGFSNKTFNVFESLPNLLEGVTVSDNYDTNLSVTVDTSFVKMNEIGTYIVTYRATDSSGNVTEESITITVEDNEAPVIIGHSNKTINIYDALPNLLEGVTASDNYDADVFLTVDTQQVKLNEIGSYLITYQATDQSGNTTLEYITITIEDNEAPIISGLSNKTFNIYDSLPDLLEGVTASDNYDTNVLVTVDTSQVNMNQLGDYVVTYQATDSSGNKTSETITITVIDNEGPIFSEISNITIDVYDTLEDLLEKVTVTDDNDNNILVTVVDPSLIDFNQIGTYTVTYQAVDTSGNVTVATGTVTVEDREAPIITGQKNLTLDVYSSLPDLLESITVTDNYDTDIKATIDASLVNMNELGTYIVTYQATDMSGNTTEEIITVSVVDNEAPVISGYSDKTIDVFGVLPNLLDGIMVDDNYDTSVEVIVDTEAVDLNTVGSYTVIYQAIDGEGNIDEVMITITVEDNEAPEVILIGDDVITIDLNSEYEELGATIVDNYDHNLDLIVDGSVNTSVIGEYTLTYYAVDSSGNQSEVLTRVVNVSDIAGPIITGIRNEVVVEKGADFNPLDGISALDNTDGSVTITYSTYYDTNIPGEYIITLVAKDSVGNKTIDYYRLVVLGSKYNIVIHFDLNSVAILNTMNGVIVNEETFNRNRKRRIH